MGCWSKLIRIGVAKKLVELSALEIVIRSVVWRKILIPMNGMCSSLLASYLGNGIL
jgi:hypothetical protein